MATHFKSSRFSLFVSIIVFLVIACNSKTDEKATEKKDATADTTTSTLQATQPKSGFTDVTLDALYTDATSFKNLPMGKRVLFVLTYLKPDTVTLSGWPTSNGSYSDDPAIKLKKGAANAVINQDTTYVGNVMLDQNEVKRIKDSIATTHATYVLFVPTPSADPKYRNHIAYVISLTKDDPALIKTPLTTGTGVTANPSPPKTN